MQPHGCGIFFAFWVVDFPLAGQLSALENEIGLGPPSAHGCILLCIVSFEWQQLFEGVFLWVPGIDSGISSMLVYLQCWVMHDFAFPAPPLTDFATLWSGRYRLYQNTDSCRKPPLQGKGDCRKLRGG